MKKQSGTKHENSGNRDYCHTRNIENQRNEPLKSVRIYHKVTQSAFQVIDNRHKYSVSSTIKKDF